VKILLCHNFYQQSGGEDAVVLALKTLLEAKGHRVIFYAEDNRKIKEYSTVQKAGFFPRTVFSSRTYKRLRRLSDQEKPDIAHVHNVFPLLSPALYVALSQADIPIVQSIHNYRLMCINGLCLRDGQICERCNGGQLFSGVRFKCYRDSYLLSGLYAFTIGWHRRLGTFDRINRFIASTRFAAEKLADSGVAALSKISILGNFLSEPLPNYGRPDMCRPYFVYVGRFSQEKGIFTLLEAFSDLRHIRLKIMGSGPLLKKMQTYIEEYDLQNIEILGYVSEDVKVHTLRNALCCIVPSECYEVFPFVLLESAAVGTPVIASRIGSLATLISGGETGLLFNPGDSGDLRSTIERVLSEPAMAIQMGQEARCWLEAAYTPEAHHTGLMDIYHKAMHSNEILGAGLIG